jgi:hypothetical protein
MPFPAFRQMPKFPRQNFPVKISPSKFSRQNFPHLGNIFRHDAKMRQSPKYPTKLIIRLSLLNQRLMFYQNRPIRGTFNECYY